MPADLVHNPILFNLVVFLASVVLLFKSADLVVFSISNYARKLGLGEYLAGFLVIALSASLPEVMASITGFSVGEENVGMGVILGTNMVHLTLVIGVVMLLSKKVEFESDVIARSYKPLGAVLLLPFILMFDGFLSRIDGIILIAAFFGYLIFLWKKEGTVGKVKKVMLKNIWRDAFVFAGCLLVVLLSSRYLVLSTLSLAQEFNISPYLLSVVILAICGALPDFAVGIRAAKKSHQELGVGDSLGSSLIELLLFFGILALIRPFQVDLLQIRNVIIFLIISIAGILFLLSRKKVSPRHGWLLFALFILFVVFELINAA